MTMPPARIRSEQIGERRDDWETALRDPKCVCPTGDGGAILETRDPFVVCQICGQRYILAVKKVYVEVINKMPTWWGGTRDERDIVPVIQTAFIPTKKPYDDV